MTPTAPKKVDLLDQVIEAFAPEEFPKSLDEKRKLQDKLTCDRDTLNNTLDDLTAAIVADVQNIVGDEYDVTPKAKTGGGRSGAKAGGKARVARTPEPHKSIDQDQIVSIVEANGTEPRGDDQIEGTTSTELAESLGGVAVATDAKGRTTASQALRDTLAYMAAEGKIKHNGINNRWSRYTPAD